MTKTYSRRRRLLCKTSARVVPVAMVIGMGGAQVAAAQQADATDNAVRQLPGVTVRGVAPDNTLQQLGAPVAAGALGNRTQLETPFSTTVVNAEMLAQRQTTKLGDVFALDASVADNSSQNGAWANYVTIRGLPIDWQNAYKIDGKPFMSYATTLPYELLDQVQLFKGASGFLFGYSAPGGLINFVTKKPPVQGDVREVSLGYRTQSLWRQTFDIGGRAGEGDTFGYRIAATHEDGETYNKGAVNKKAVSLALDARLTDRLTWDFQAMYQRRKANDADPTIRLSSYAGDSLPSPVRADDNRLVGPGTYLDNEFQYYATGLEYALASDWTARVDYSYAKTRTRRAEAVLFLRDQAGNYDDYRSDYGEHYTFNNWQGSVSGRVSTGGISHDLTAGVSWQEQKNDYAGSGVYSKIGTGSLWTQNNNAYYTSGTMGSLNMYRAGVITQKSLFVSDTLTLSDRWSVLAGLRYTNYDQVGYGTNGRVSSNYRKTGVLTPTLAVMYKITPQTMAYASYIEALEPGTQVGTGYANTGELLDPLKSRQYEVGVKADHDDWAATAALFRIEKAAQFTDSGNRLVQDGESVYQGIELGATKTLARHWTIGTNLMWLNAEYTKGLNNIGQRVVGAPRFVAAAQIAYQVPQVPGLRLTVDAKYTGSSPLRPSNNLSVDAYTLVNVGASYETRIQGYDTTFRLAVDNLTNRKYWMYQYENYIKAGDPRTVSLTASMRF
ncbi:TonB-dependent siderophore receptor [Pusillimonas minor]|nr:TonB-dependent receptor [Pusillimonas minor]